MPFGRNCWTCDKFFWVGTTYSGQPFLCWPVLNTTEYCSPPPQKKTKLYDIVLFLHPLVVSGPSCPCVFKYSIYSHRKKNWKGNHQSPNTFVPSNLTLSQSNKSIQIKKIEIYLGSDIQSKHDTKAPNKRRYKFN